jgi:pimeloyl-ACP methyl ester carboxylesterase
VLRLPAGLSALATLVALSAGCGTGNAASGASSDATRASSPAVAPVSSVATSPVTSATTAGSSVPASALPPARIAWHSCGDHLQCGSLAVPLDYSDPAKGTFPLAVERRPAGNAKERIGSLLVNPGGPGVPGTELVAHAGSYLSTDLLDHFDVVGWDPRGTGGPSAIDCTDDLDPFLVASDPTPATAGDADHLRQIASDFAAGCEARSGTYLPYVSTEASARDMDRIRQALDEPKISYLGFSYGSELGATWATMFPGTVRAAVLDGALDANLGWEQKTGQQLAGLERGLTHALDSCASRHSCPFNNDGAPMAAFAALSAALDAKPLVVDPARSPVNQSVLFYAVASSLRDSSLWDELYRALGDAQHGDGRRLLDLYDTYAERSSRGTFSDTLESFIAISCLDDNGPTDPAGFPALDARLHQVAPHMDFGAGYNYVCGGWPVRSTPRPKATGIGAGPILVLGTTGDPITPLVSSRALASDLEDGVLLTVKGERHTGYRVNDCSRKAVDDYLVDVAVPKPGTSCD